MSEAIGASAIGSDRRGCGRREVRGLEFGGVEEVAPCGFDGVGICDVLLVHFFDEPVIGAEIPAHGG